MENQQPNTKFVTWKDFFAEIFDRIKSFAKHPIMVLYLFIIVAFIGSSGVWLPFVISDTADKCFDYDGTLSIGLATYCIAILSATMADQLLSPNDKNRTVRFFTFSLFALSYTFSYITIFKKNSYFGFITTALAFLLWIITYSIDSSKRDEETNESLNPKGGDVRKVELSGNTVGFAS